MGAAGAPYDDTKVIRSGPLTLNARVTHNAPSDDLVRVQLNVTSAPVQGAKEPLWLHWGVVLKPNDDRSKYIRPPDALFPPETDPRPGEPSVQTKFVERKLEFKIRQPDLPAGLVFLVFIKGERGFRGQWFKGDGGGSFYVDLMPALAPAEADRRDKSQREVEAAAKQAAAEEAARQKREQDERDAALRREVEFRDRREKRAQEFITRELKAKGRAGSGMTVFKEREDKYDFGSLYLRVLLPAPSTGTSTPLTPITPSGSAFELLSTPTPGDLVVASSIGSCGADVYLHWGLKTVGRHGWTPPPAEQWPPGTRASPDGKAVQTLLPLLDESGVRGLRISNFPGDAVGFFAVLHIPDGPHHMNWIMAQNGGDIYVALTPPPPLPGFKKGESVSDVCKEMLDGIIEREVEYGSWTLMHRYSHASHLINDVIKEDQDCWSAMYVWMRYSQIRVLDWQRRYNTQPRQLSHVQMSVVTLLANRFKTAPSVRWLVRLVMSCVGRGGSGDLGQRIRDDILAILRHHRAWGYGSMMEQWHQKLHNNTNPDDVIICNALIKFWQCDGDIGAYWDVIHKSGLNRQILASYEQPITVEPDFPGHIKDTMLWELERYGALLKAVHLGTDFNSIVDWCQGFLDSDVKVKVDGFLHARSHDGPITDVLRAVAHARQSLANQLVFADWLSDDKRRDLIFLDLALESDARRCVESCDGLGHDGTLWSHLTAVRAAAASLKCSEVGLRTERELERAIHEVHTVVDRLGRQGESHDVGLRAAAALNILRNVLTEIVDRYKDHLGPLSTCLGTAFGAQKEIIATFIEEAIRGGPAFVLSHLIRKAQPAVRRVADLGPFTTIAPCDKESKGPVVVFNKLRESIGLNFKSGTVIIANTCDGDEDVPLNTSFVVIGSTVDVLSHVSVRARNEHHGLVACLDADKLAELRTLHGCIVKARLFGDDFQISILDESGRMSPSRGPKSMMKRVRSSGIITPPSGMMTPPGGMFALKRFGSRNRLLGAIMSPGAEALRRKLSETSLREIGQQKQKQKQKKAFNPRQLAAPWAIRPSEFTNELVGSKSLNLQRLVALGMPTWIRTPPSVAVPNGAMRKVMSDPANKEREEKYAVLLEKIRKARPGELRYCRKIREVIMSLEAPVGLQEALRGILDDLGCENIDEALPDAWEAVKGVWASVWNERAHLARIKLRLDVDDVDMAVLCQKVIDADYAFVIHTVNPTNKDKNEIYAEAVIGLGETLVGNAPGQALGFIVRKDQDIDTVKPAVRSYPSKSVALVGGAYIFRSDSNAEDLEGFAGAGLHDSIPLKPHRIVDIDYSKERIMHDDHFRDEFMRGVGKIGLEVEALMDGTPQDIEGVYKDGEFFVVQARPQV